MMILDAEWCKAELKRIVTDQAETIETQGPKLSGKSQQVEEYEKIMSSRDRRRINPNGEVTTGKWYN